MPRKRELTVKQRLFIQEYLIDKNASRAARAAGYSKLQSDHIGFQLLKKPLVKVEIQRGLAEQQEKLRKKARRYEVTKEKMIVELSKIAYSDIRDYAEVTAHGIKIKKSAGWKSKPSRAVKKLNESVSQHGGSQGIELHDKIGAIAQIARMCGWITDKVEHSGPDGGPIASTVVEFTPEERKAELDRLRKLREAVGDE